MCTLHTNEGVCAVHTAALGADEMRHTSHVCAVAECRTQRSESEYTERDRLDVDLERARLSLLLISQKIQKTIKSSTLSIYTTYMLTE